MCYFVFNCSVIITGFKTFVGVQGINSFKIEVGSCCLKIQNDKYIDFPEGISAEMQVVGSKNWCCSFMEDSENYDIKHCGKYFLCMGMELQNSLLVDKTIRSTY